jgi:FlaA1/EpsC-like NDP-sugar epimerase
MFEELMISGENIVDTAHEKIMVLKNGKGYNWEQLLSYIEEIVQTTTSFDSNLIKEKLKEFVPEYSPAKENEIIKLTPSGRIEFH